MSGGPSRSGDRNRSNNSPSATASALVDAERVTHCAVRRAPPPLAVDVGAPAELDDVVQQQEVTGEAELFDHLQLVLDLVHGLFVLRMRRRVVDGRAPPHELAQPRHLVVPERHRIVGQVRRRELQVEGALLARSRRCVRPRPASARTGAAVRRRCASARTARRAASRRSRRANGGRAPPRAHAPAGGAPGWRSARCWWRSPRRRARIARLHERVVAMTVERIAVVPELDQHTDRDRTRRRALADARSAAAGPSRTQCGRHRALAASGEHEPVVVVRTVVRARRDAASASDASDVRGAPFSPASCASLIARASARTRPCPRASTNRCSPGGSAMPFGGSWAPSVSSAPNTVGRPSGRAVSANRTMP